MRRKQDMHWTIGMRINRKAESCHAAKAVGLISCQILLKEPDFAGNPAIGPARLMPTT